MKIRRWHSGHETGQQIVGLLAVATIDELLGMHVDASDFGDGLLGAIDLAGGRRIL